MEDTGLRRNLISYAFYHKLHEQPTLRPTNCITIVAGNNSNIALVGFGIFFVSLNDMVLFHDFEVVNGLPLNVVIVGEIMSSKIYR